jgi:hypothetical protein
MRFRLSVRYRVLGPIAEVFGLVIAFSVSYRYLALSTGSNPRLVHVGFVVDEYH